MKKKIAVILTAVCLVCAGTAAAKISSMADTASISVSAQAQTVSKEEEVDVTVSVTSDVPIGKIDSTITYDDTVLQYVTDETEAVAGASGTIRITDSFDEETTSASYVLKFKALEVGVCTLSIENTVIEAFDSASVMQAAASSVTVTVETNETVSGETDLSDLLVAPADVAETFSPELHTYHATVGVETEQLILSAIPVSDAAVVTVDAPEVLAVGENKVTVTVTALSGDFSEYVIYVTRLETALPENVEENEEDPAESAAENADGHTENITGNEEAAAENTGDAAENTGNGIKENQGENQEGLPAETENAGNRMMDTEEVYNVVPEPVPAEGGFSEGE